MVGDAESDEPWVAQAHARNAAEVGFGLGTEGVLRSRGGCRGDHVDETVGGFVNQADALLARFGRDEHYHAQAVAVGHGAVVADVVVKRQVRNNHAVNAAGGAVAAEVFKAILHDGVEVAHEQQRHVGHVPADVAQLVHQDAEGHAVAQGPGRGLLNDRAVGHGVAEGDAYFYHVHALFGQLADDAGRVVNTRAAGAEVEREQGTGLLQEKLVNAVHV